MRADRGDTTAPGAFPADRVGAGHSHFDRSLFGWTIGVALVMLIAAALYRYHLQSEQLALPGVAAPAPAIAPHEPVASDAMPDASPRYPVPIVGDSASLPRLAESTPVLQQALKELIGAEMTGRLLYTDELARRFVATVDSLPRRGSLSQLRPVKPPPGSFITSESAGSVSIDPANDWRYREYVRLLDLADTKTMVALYYRFYPLFEEQYRLLGYPTGHFNDRLIEAIDDLLDAPEIAPPIQLVRPRTMFQFADADIEQRSAGQKAMIRLGIENAKVVKAKLRDVRGALSSPAALRRSAFPQ